MSSTAPSSTAPSPPEPTPLSDEPSAAPEYVLQGPLAAFVRRHIWAIALITGIVTVTALRPLLRHIPEAPPVMGQVPDFALVDAQGRAFSLADMRGEVWLVGFVFTRCPSVCPAVSQAMAALQQRFEREGVQVKLLTVTVDPEHDTPQVLRSYAEGLGADPARWRFVTGDKPAIERLVVGGFKLAVGQRQELEPGIFDIAHSTKLALIDPDGGIRGYYGTDPDGVDEAFHRAQHVLRDAAAAAAGAAEAAPTSAPSRAAGG
jgi:protein SCO1/2